MGKDASTNIYNISLMYKHIRLFYKTVASIEFEEIFFNPKEAVENLIEDEFRKLAELLTGIAAQCEKRMDFLHVMQTMDHELSTQLFTILTERISAYTEENTKLKDMSGQEDISEDEDNHNTLYIKIDNLELENSKLHEEIKILSNKIGDLTKSNFTFEIMIKESESKYQDLINSLGDKNDFSSKEYEDSVALSIQISELKGKLEAKEKNLAKFKEEKDKLLEEYKLKIFSVQKENESLREKSVKYDVLKEKMEKFSIDEVNNLKAKNIQSERTIKDQEEKLKKLKNYDTDRAKLLQKIEELNSEISQETEKSTELKKENNYYKEMIIQFESEVKFYKKKLDSIQVEVIYENEKASLYDIENDSDVKKTNLDLETKLKFLHSDKETLTKEKNELDKSLKEKLTEVEELKQEISKNSKKLNKYAKHKEEKHTLITRITDLMEKLHSSKSEIDNLKLSKDVEKSDIENKYLVK
jgi:chromosome segregation ATPase